MISIQKRLRLMEALEMMRKSRFTDLRTKLDELTII